MYYRTLWGLLSQGQERTRGRGNLRLAIFNSSLKSPSYTDRVNKCLFTTEPVMPSSLKVAACLFAVTTVAFFSSVALSHPLLVASSLQDIYCPFPSKSWLKAGPLPCLLTITEKALHCCGAVPFSLQKKTASQEKPTQELSSAEILDDGRLWTICTFRGG